MMRDCGYVYMDSQDSSSSKDDYIKKCEEFSSNIHSKIDFRNIYGCILSPDEEDKENLLVSISLTNEYLINLDKKYFGGDGVEGYHPYFFEFVGQVDKKDTYKRIFRNSGTAWIPMTFIEEDSVDYNNYRKKAENVVAVSGTIVLAASPIVRVKGRMEFNPEERDEISTQIEGILDDIEKNFKPYREKCDEGLKLPDVKKRLNELFDDNVQLDINVYNVGQGNNISIDVDDKRIFFDVGASLFEPKDIVLNESFKTIQRSVINEVNSKIPELIILSHWDIDHILGASFWGDNTSNSSDLGKGYLVYKDTSWLAPDFDLVHKKTKSAFILCCYLLKNKKMLLINELESNIISCNNFKLLQGTGRGKGNEKNNNIGLVMELSLNKDSDKIGEDSCNRQYALLMGDCDFQKLGYLTNTDIQYDILVTSHHGSDKTLPNVYGNRNARGIISVGIDNRYSHPGLTHMAYLQRHGFDIYFTIDVVKIEISMSTDKGTHLKTIPLRVV